MWGACAVVAAGGVAAAAAVFNVKTVVLSLCSVLLVVQTLAFCAQLFSGVSFTAELLSAFGVGITLVAVTNVSECNDAGVYTMGHCMSWSMWLARTTLSSTAFFVLAVLVDRHTPAAVAEGTAEMKLAAWIVYFTLLLLD